MIIREDAIYGRQSVDRKDSISIESQIDFCKYELKGGSCKEAISASTPTRAIPARIPTDPSSKK